MGRQILNQKEILSQQINRKTGLVNLELVSYLDMYSLELIQLKGNWAHT